MRPFSSALCSSPSLLLRLRIKAAAINLSIKQRLNRVWLLLTSHYGIPISSHPDLLTDSELDLDTPFPEFWSEYLEDPEVISACAQHLERCLKNPSAKHHGH